VHGAGHFRVRWSGRRLPRPCRATRGLTAPRPLIPASSPAAQRHVTLCRRRKSGVYGVLRRKDALLTQGKKLVIVESPTKMRSIQGYLGDGYEVLSSVGHIRDLADKKDIPAEDKKAYG